MRIAIHFALLLGVTATAACGRNNALQTDAGSDALAACLLGSTLKDGSGADAREEVASIRNSMPTNSAEVDVVVFSDGSAERTLGTPGALRPSFLDPAPQSFPPGSPEVLMFLCDLGAVGDVSTIAADPRTSARLAIAASTPTAGQADTARRPTMRAPAIPSMAAGQLAIPVARLRTAAPPTWIVGRPRRFSSAVTTPRRRRGVASTFPGARRSQTLI